MKVTKDTKGKGFIKAQLKMAWFFWLLVLLWMIVIFIFSAQPASKSSALSMDITDLLIKIAGMVINLDIEVVTAEAWIKQINGIVRTWAHGLVYMVLAILTASAFKRSKIRVGKSIVYSFLVCVLYGLSDEFHQMFVPGRAAEIKDLVVDYMGAAVGLVFFTTFYFTFSRKKDKMKDEKLTDENI